MKVSELCKKAGVSKELVRHYESLGLLTPGWSPAGSKSYRVYDEQAVKRLEYIRIGKSIGFTLKELKPLLDAFMAEQLSEAEQVKLLQDKLADTEEILRNARQVKHYIEEKLKGYHQG